MTTTAAAAAIIGRELRRLRLREGLTQAEVAAVLGLERTHVSRRERGQHLVRLDHIAEHAQACGGSLGHVLVQLDLAAGALAPGDGR